MVITMYSAPSNNDMKMNFLFSFGTLKMPLKAVRKVIATLNRFLLVCSG